MQLFKRVGATILVVLVVVFITASCFASGAEVLVPAEIFGTLYSSYLAARGIGVVLSENNVASSSANTMAADPAASLWLDLYNRSNSRLDSSEQMSIDDWVDFAESHVSTNIGPAGNVAPTATTFQLSSDLVEWFDKITTDVLSIDLGVPSESGHYHSSGNFFSSAVSSVAASAESFTWQGIDIPAISVGDVIGLSGSTELVVLDLVSSSPVYGYSRADGYNFYFVSNDSFSIRVGFGANASSISSSVLSYENSLFDYAVLRYRPYSFNYTLPHLTLDSSYPYPLTSDGTAILNPANSNSSMIQLRPEDKYNEGLRDGEGNVLPKGDVYIPDPAAAGYQADILTGTWNLPWNDAFADSLNDILAGVRELVLANDSVLELDEVAPDPVEIPFLPPAAITDLPSFDFSLSGIWHYVVDWVASLSSGFTLISSAWSAEFFNVIS